MGALLSVVLDRREIVAERRIATRPHAPAPAGQARSAGRGTVPRRTIRSVDRAEYDKLDQVEDADVVVRRRCTRICCAVRARDAPRRAGAAVLDAGCGTGGLLARLAARLSRSADAIGPRRRAGRLRAAARARAGGRSAPARSTRCPSPMAPSRAIFSADVLCHRGVDERRRAGRSSTAASAEAACWCSTCRPIAGCCRATTPRFTMCGATPGAASRVCCARPGSACSIAAIGTRCCFR